MTEDQMGESGAGIRAQTLNFLDTSNNLIRPDRLKMVVHLLRELSAVGYEDSHVGKFWL